MRKYLKHLTALLLVVSMVLPSFSTLQPAQTVQAKDSAGNTNANIKGWWNAGDTALKCGANTSVPVAVQNNYSKVSKCCNETKHPKS